MRRLDRYPDGGLQVGGDSLFAMAPPAFNPTMLRLARESQGFTQTELGKASGIGQGTISKYEKGVTRPSEEQIAAIGEALQFPPSFFADRDDRPASVLYRSRTMRSLKLEAHVRARLNLARVIARRLLADVEIDVTARFPEPDRSYTDAERAAIEIRRAWSVPPGPIQNVTELIELAGGIVVQVALPTDKVVAAYMHPLDDPVRWFFVNSEVEAGDRIRFSLAHELGHAVLHESELAPDSGLAEAESNAFAGAFLMPADDLRRDLPRARLELDHLLQLKERWGVSIQALLIRVRELGDVSSSDFARLYKELSYRGWRSVEPVHIDAEAPTVLASVMGVHQESHGLNDRELAADARVSQEVAHNLLPSLFSNPRPRGLSVVPSGTSPRGAGRGHLGVGSVALIEE